MGKDILLPKCISCAHCTHPSIGHDEEISNIGGQTLVVVQFEESLFQRSCGAGETGDANAVCVNGKFELRSTPVDPKGSATHDLSVTHYWKG